MMKRYLLKIRLFLLLMLLPVAAHAGTSIGLSSIMADFQSTTQGWYSAIFSDALDLFGALFGIEIVWLVVTWLIGGKDVHEIFTSFIKKLLSIGFFYTVLEYSSQWVPWIINGFKNVAVGAGGAPVTTVSDIAMTGLRAFVLCIDGGPAATAHDASTAMSDLWNFNLSGAASAAVKAGSAALGSISPLDFMMGMVVGFILLMAFIYVVLELVAVQLEGMIVLSAGVIMLGFGGARWTARFVEGYMQYAVAVGVRLMILTLWASFIEWKVNPLIKTTLINGNAGPEAYGIVLILALLVAWLAKKLPGIASSILSGSSTLSGSELYDGVKKGVAAGAAVAAAAATGGATLAAGGISALTSGTMSAGGAGAGAAGGEAASSAVPAPPAPKPTSQDNRSAVPAPTTAPVSGGTTRSAPTETAGRGDVPQAAPSGGTTRSAPTETAGRGSTPTETAGHSAAPAETAGRGSTPQTAPSGGTADSVDHRPAAPNAPAGGDTGGQSGSDTKAPPPPPGLLEQAAKRAKSVHDQVKSGLTKAHKALDIGTPSTGGVSAPSLGVKHLSD